DQAEGCQDHYAGDHTLGSLPSEQANHRPQIYHAAYYGLAGEFVDIVSPHSEADPVAILLQTLIAFGNCIGRTANFRVEADTHYLNLNVVAVGRTSKGRKGTSWKYVENLFQKVDQEWVKNCVQSGLSSGEGLIWAVRDPVQKDDEGVKDKRLLVLESEFSAVLKHTQRDHNILSAIVRQSFDTGNLRT